MRLNYLFILCFLKTDRKNEVELSVYCKLIVNQQFLLILTAQIKHTHSMQSNYDNNNCTNHVFAFYAVDFRKKQLHKSRIRILCSQSVKKATAQITYSHSMQSICEKNNCTNQAYAFYAVNFRKNNCTNQTLRKLLLQTGEQGFKPEISFAINLIFFLLFKKKEKYEQYVI